MTDKAFLDKLFYEFDKQQCNLELAYAYLDKEGNPKFSKWKKYLEAQSDYKFILKVNNRTILPNEIVLDIEEPERFSEVLKGVKKEFEFYEAYKTGSKGYHIHLWFSQDLTQEEKLYVIKEYGCEEKEGFNETKKLKSFGFEPINSEQILEVLEATIKEDKINKILTFYGEISAYTEEEQLNISNQAPSSTGKSYIPMEIADLFPQQDVFMIGYCSPTAFFHDKGFYDKETNTIHIDLERKILVFLDQPHTLLLQHLRPLLSHDKKEIQLKITDKSQKAGLRTKNVIVRGYPAVIFCSAGLKLDEQEATRFLMLSPETTKSKIKSGILEKIKKSSNKTKYLNELNKDPKRKQLKERIEKIKEANVSEILIPENLSQEISE